MNPLPKVEAKLIKSFNDVSLAEKKHTRNAFHRSIWCSNEHEKISLLIGASRVAECDGEEGMQSVRKTERKYLLWTSN